MEANMDDVERRARAIYLLENARFPFSDWDNLGYIVKRAFRERARGEILN
jgi:hypothetical protein